jgi:signal transduction histidine kinase
VEFVKPIVSLKEAAEAIGEGNLNTKVEYDKHRTDEIGELCRSFTDMENKLSESVELKIQYEKENRELISNISHDLKTPITTIKGYVEGIMDGVADTPEKRDRYLRMIYNKANEMDVLINELSLYANINNNAIPYEFHRVNVKAYFSDCMEEIQTTLATNNMMLKYKDYVDPDVKVVVDPDQLKRVINNIITNAIKYSDKENGLVEIYLYDEGDTIKVSISDDGKGIDEESLPHIFDRTFRADSARQSRGGSGLGLAICKKIIEEHGGKIWAKSKPGVGTTIMFELNKYTKGDEANEQSSDN